MKKYKQHLLSEKGKTFVGRYITPHMLEKATKLEGLSKEEALEKYGKNRYRPNPNAKVIGVLNH